MSFKIAQTLPPNPATSRGTFTQLGTDPKGEKLVYCQSRTVIIRPLDSSASTIVYSQHAHPTTVARISPSGFYCASADVAGNVRVWDLAGDEQVLKLEIKALGGRITDLSWDGESKRIGVVGEGKDRFGSFFFIDSGSSCGEVSGHSKVANSIALKSARPFRAVTAGDDGNVVFYNGVPYKYAKALTTHQKFVQAVSYAPNGETFVSAGSDGKIFLYNGSTGDAIGPLVDGSETAHKGTIFSVAFSHDSASVLSCGADGLLKKWSVSSTGGKLDKTFDLNGGNVSASASKADDQLVGCTFAGSGRAVALSLAGELSVVDVSSGKIEKLHGAGKAISPGSLVRSPDGNLLAGSFDGKVLRFDATGKCAPVLGSSTTGSAVTGLAVATQADCVWSVAMDDTLRKISNGKFDATAAISLTGQPRSVAAGPAGTVIVATAAGIDVVPSSLSSKTHTPLNDSPTAVACSPDGKHVAYGAEDAKVRLCTLTREGNVQEVAKLESGRSTITALAFSRDGKLLAAGESNGKIMVYDVGEKKIKFNQWVFHTARINAIDFSPDGSQAVSASLDTNVYVWSTVRPMKSIAIKSAFPGGAQGCCWIQDGRFASAGADGTVKVFDVTKAA
ncbi:putative actin interacting protein 1 [Acaromyces ingoldii]|uniref:Putative actin interacting protein 1 n=1 Tax=Acaromyces ingoldii TaxID=215250 RepID=A0A316YMM8_9BASI|nr:putative actin interacting protein 1 [Acaromyces ingoldii]PWN90800.1 putative actin interacting protein 1 [Acaromyces ingoldii]